MSIVIFLSFFSFLIISRTSFTSSGSSAEVGSSNRRISGSSANPLAIATLCFCPPESSLGKLSFLSARPTVSNTFPAISSAFFTSVFFTILNVFTILSFTVICGNRLKFWNIIPVFSKSSFFIFLSIPLSCKSWPSISIFPPVSVSRSAIHLKIVDFPLPLGPIRETASPLFIVKFMSSSIRLFPNCFFRLITSIIFSFISFT